MAAATMIVQPLWWVVACGALLAVAQLVVARRPVPVLRLAICAVVMVIGLHPVFTSAPITGRDHGADVVVVIDRTTSMGADDYQGGQPRMSGAASDIARLVGDYRGARFSVIAMDDNARLEVPFTTDGDAVAGYAAALGWQRSTQGSGSDISSGVGLAAQELEASRRDRPQAQRLLVYCGDGEQTIDTAPASFAPLADELTDALVLGYGTQAGGIMQTYPGSGEYVTFQGAPAVSHIDQAALQAIAEQTRGRYAHRDAPGPLPATSVSVQPAAVATPTSSDPTWVLALVLTGLLGVEVWRTVRQQAGWRSQRRALPPRCGGGVR
ncbi:VWA domain-containing protein [Propionibacterium freudenreichii]|uniref:vWA domain-containing protein n=1 Tax=Propionibacterium freudenreichii TaxID=1744 RepID=UPI002549F10D|nr:vWA domain-containing protein [Propionibacterium freudenreichii]MDK9352891.1 VWA domain-containing protein [Propionibacterium freudenreichii]